MDSFDNRYWTGIFKLAGWLMKTAGCAIAIGAGILGYQIVLWMRDGHWTTLPVAAALNLPASGAVAAFGVVMVIALRLTEAAARRLLAK
jgi:hypothetical protein